MFTFYATSSFQQQMATLSSPTKKQYNLPSTVVPTPESSTSERGSFTQAASTEWTDLIKTRARDTRFGKSSFQA